MHFECSFLEISFELFLFSLFAYKLYELGKAYLIPFLYQSMTEEKNIQTEILEKEKLLISTHHRLENQITQQKRTFLILEKKVQAWHATMQAEIEQAKRNETTRIEHIKLKRIAQRNHLTHALLVQQTLPQALAETNHQLMASYEGQNGAELFSRVINNLLESTTDENHDQHS